MRQGGKDQERAAEDEDDPDPVTAKTASVMFAAASETIAAEAENQDQPDNVEAASS